MRDTKTVLLVDDDPVLRRFMGRFLEDRKWVLLVARDGAEALQISERYPDRIDLLVTDVVMPRVDGFSLVSHVKERRPEVGVVYISGYLRRVHRLLTSEETFLQKPFIALELQRAIDDALSSCRCLREEDAP